MMAMLRMGATVVRFEGSLIGDRGMNSSGYDTPASGRASRLISRCAIALLLLLRVEASYSQTPETLPPTDKPPLIVTRDRASGIYRLGETVGWTVTLPAGEDGRGLHYNIRKNARVPLRSGPLHFTAGVARIETPAREPAMIYVEISSDAHADAVTLGSAVEPERLQPSVPMPEDFASFWKRHIRRLENVPLHPILSPAPSERSGVDYATFRLDFIGGAHIHGQVARPSVGEHFPALIIFQWASPPYPLQKQWVTDRAAEGWLTLNTEPHDVLPDQPQSYYDTLPPQLIHYESIGRDDRDKSYFLRMYLSNYQTIEYLATRPDWDGKTLVVMGTSMGGQQSVCAAALNPRVTAVIVNEPAGADSNGERHGRMSGYPFWPPDDDQAMHAALYFDTVNCAPYVSAPTLVAMGFTDTLAPPAGVWTMFNQIRAPKEAAPMVDSPHNHLATPEQQRPYNERSARWLEALLKTGRPPLPVP